MDALITKNGVETRLSSIGLLVTDFQDSSPSVTTSKREVTNRSGYVFSGAVHKEKRISISGTFIVPSAYSLEEKKDQINGLISNDEPFYITKMLPTSGLYDFELPGQSTSDLDLLAIPHQAYKYRYKVVVENEISYTFMGYSAAGIRMKFAFEALTVELPFGETIPKTVNVNTSIDYKGTAKCSQLEWPWTMKLTSNASQSGDISVKTGDRNFIYHAVTPLKNGDILLLKGVETTLNALNVNDKTNYEHFILQPNASNKISITTNFKGTIQLLNFVELYK
ncbi:phage tail protein [Enterococcus thailandicus]|uniref:phage tail domain-containing protein n=1 Tax=Enterococcus thailandicus TaxID=417368 RepID=UPI00288C8ABC|nr:phage tail domain-containing protein [Enterococcus thailandicus]MDT2735419.1 phage tail protein [Enterococcus thailandicus]